jgi:ubiquinone/menaquinone biosynthesis C-methylase UbiE
MSSLTPKHDLKSKLIKCGIADANFAQDIQIVPMRKMETENTWFSHHKGKFQKAHQLLSPCISEQGGVWADFGCGEGIFTAILFELVGPECEIYAIDKNQRALNRLKDNFRVTFPKASLHIHHADFTKPLSLPPLDGFILANALHFIRDDQKGHVLEELAMNIKPDGKVIVIEYNTSRGNYAVPFPLPEDEFINIARELDLRNPRIVTRVPSSFLSEMYAGSANVPISKHLHNR